MSEKVGVVFNPDFTESDITFDNSVILEIEITEFLETLETWDKETPGPMGE